MGSPPRLDPALACDEEGGHAGVGREGGEGDEGLYGYDDRMYEMCSLRERRDLADGP